MINAVLIEKRIYLMNMQCCRRVGSRIGLIPCHPSVGTELFAVQALAEDKLSGFRNNELQQLAEDNAVIYKKCKAALRNNGILIEPPASFQAY